MRFFFSESSKDFGGQAQQILHQMTALTAAGHPCILACPANSGIAEEAERRKLPWSTVPFRNSIHPPSLLRVRRLLKQHRIEVALCHSGHDASVLCLAARSLRSRPTLLRVRTYLAKLPRPSSVNWSVDRTLVPSEFLRQSMIGSPDIRGDRVESLRPLIPFEQLREQSRLPLPSGLADWVSRHHPIITHAAMLRPEKAHSLALKVVAGLRSAFPKIGYVAVGSGRLDASLRQQATALGLDQSVYFAGLMLPPAPMIAISDLVIMPSNMEPLGLTQLEALALGVPVAVSDAGGLPETVSNNETGWIFPSGEVESWTAGLTRILSDPETAKVYASAGRTQVENRYSSQQHIRSLLAAIHTAAVGRGKATAPTP